MSQNRQDPEFSAKLWELDDRIRDLRDKVEKGADALSVSRSTAVLYVDCLGRIVAFSNQLDAALEYQLLLEDCAFQDNMRRANSALRLDGKLMDLLNDAITGLLRSVGGEKAIAIQAVGEWAARNSAQGPTDPDRVELDRIMKILVTRAAKAPPKP